MSVTTVPFKASREDVEKEGWGVPAPKMDAKDYPKLGSADAKRKGVTVKVPKIPVMPANITHRVYSTYEDVVAQAGDKYQAWVLRSANDLEKDAAEKGAKAKARDLSVWNGEPITFDGNTVDIFSAPEGGKQSAESKVAGSVLSKVEGMDGLSADERLAFVLAELEKLRG